METLNLESGIQNLDKFQFLLKMALIAIEKQSSVDKKSQTL